jgi:hypothetical protein
MVIIGFPLISVQEDERRTLELKIKIKINK